MGDFGSVYIADTANGKVFSARLHYPVDVNEVCSSLNKPLNITYNNSSIYVAEYGAGKLSCIDLDYSMVYNPSKMTVNQLRRELRKHDVLRYCGRNPKKPDLQRKLNEWIRSKGRADVASNRQNQTNAAPIIIQDKEALKPTAQTFNKADMLFVADEVEQEILQLKVESNGVTIIILLKRPLM